MARSTKENDFSNFVTVKKKEDNITQVFSEKL